MPHSSSFISDRIYRFAEFALDPASGELRNGDSVTSLQEKPLQLLMTLLDHPERVVTRQQLRERMWDSKTVVDYDQGINAAIKKVRDALDDSADRPRLIETVAKRGYRLLVAVTVVAVAPASAEPVTTRAVPEQTTLGPAAGDKPVPARFTARHWLWIVPLVVALTIGLYATQFGAAPRTQIHSLAVLPLQDLSPAGGHEFFADGITEEVTTNLAQTLPLRVISRTSVMRYKGTDKPITQIARELGVEAIVEGSVARSGDRVAVTVQLIDAIEDRHLWAEKYNRRVEDILAIEAELSQAIASQIGGTLGQHRATRRNVRAVDPTVHELCLMGRYHVSRRTGADFAKAEEYFQRAISLDPGHAAAHAGLADVYALQPFYSSVPGADAAAKAEAAARRALELDDSLAEAHATLGLIKISSREWPKAAAEFRRALELNPNYATAHHWYAYYLRFANRLDEACAELEIARQLDPLSAIINGDQGEMLNAARRYPEARMSLRRAIDLAPEFGRPHAQLSVTELATGHPDEAVKEARAALKLDPDNPATIAQVGFTFAVGGETVEATRLLAILKDAAARNINVSMYAAMVEAGLGRRDEALSTLEQQARSPNGNVLQGIQHWYAFERLRTEPRFQQVLSQAW
jgi:TolB-like protein/DNA-binding winged helix-turn-helix (wHTH) protein/Tfp pilus assembly protein PilF